MRITEKVLADAIRAADPILRDPIGLDQRLEAVLAAQPNLMTSVFAVIKHHRTTRQETTFLIRMLVICSEAMDRSRYSWQLISEEEQDRHLGTIVGRAKLSDGLAPSEKNTLAAKIGDEHPEKYLFAFANAELMHLRRSQGPTPSDKHVLLCTMNLVECIARGHAEQRPT